jgi:folate-binding protein YgfZ
MENPSQNAPGTTLLNLSVADIPADFGDALAEYRALGESAGVLDMSSRSRLCLTGADRVRFLHGQVTNEIKKLRPGQGCYAALITAKGKMQSDVNIYCLPEELLLDFEPGLATAVSQRLEKYIIADDVQIVDVSEHYKLLSVQGPRAGDVVRQVCSTLFKSAVSESSAQLPEKPFDFISMSDPSLGEVYLMNQRRLGEEGYDLFLPTAAADTITERVLAAVKSFGGRRCGWQAFELLRVEAGIPLFGTDMDETNFPLEAGLEQRAISFSKGCYIGQEVISRVHTFGQVTKALRGLRLADDLQQLPVKGDKLRHAGKEVGYITSAIASPKFGGTIALGYVRKEVNQIGTELILQSAGVLTLAKVVELPFV